VELPTDTGLNHHSEGRELERQEGFDCKETATEKNWWARETLVGQKAEIMANYGVVCDGPRVEGAGFAGNKICVNRAGCCCVAEMPRREPATLTEAAPRYRRANELLTRSASSEITRPSRDKTKEVWITAVKGDNHTSPETAHARTTQQLRIGTEKEHEAPFAR